MTIEDKVGTISIIKHGDRVAIRAFWLSRSVAVAN